MTGSPPPPGWWSFLLPLGFGLLASDALAGDEILLLPSDSSYDVGERVEFALINNSQETITLPSATWWRIRDDEGAVVDGCDLFPQEHEVPPGEWVSAWWDQVSCADDQPVPQGLYRIQATYESDCCPGETLSAEAFFDIGVVTVATASWGRIKLLFGVRPAK